MSIDKSNMLNPFPSNFLVSKPKHNKRMQSDKLLRCAPQFAADAKR